MDLRAQRPWLSVAIQALCLGSQNKLNPSFSSLVKNTESFLLIRQTTFCLSLLIVFGRQAAAQAPGSRPNRTLVQDAAVGCLAAYCVDPEEQRRMLEEIGATSIQAFNHENVRGVAYTIGDTAYFAFAGTEGEKRPGRGTFPFGNLQVPSFSLGLTAPDVMNDLAFAPAFYNIGGKPGLVACAHGGMARHAALAEDFINNYNEEAKKNGITHFVLTGHSLGGAAAEIAMSRSKTLGTKEYPANAVSFGAPPGFSPNAANELGEREYLLTIGIGNTGDPVNNLVVPGYFHADGTNITINDRGEINGPKGPRDFIPETDDHRMINYNKHAEEIDNYLNYAP